MQENTLNGVVLLIHAMNYPDRTDEDRPYTHLGEFLRDGAYAIFKLDTDHLTFKYEMRLMV